MISKAVAWYGFLAAVTLASLLPMVWIPVTNRIIPISVAFWVVTLINILGAYVHVAATGWFFTDPAMRAHFRSKPLRYIMAPVLIIGSSALLFQFADRVTAACALMAYLAWQLWHYQKQNFGLLAFVAAGTDRVPLSIWERRTLAIAALPGILGFFRFFDVNLPEQAEAFRIAHRVGGIFYLPVAICFVIAVAKNPHLLANRLRLAFFVYGTLFFVPTYIFSDPGSAITGFALAHGLQYLVFMTIVSGHSPRPLQSLAFLATICAIGYFILSRGMGLRWNSPDFAYGGAVYGAALGLVMVHFVFDADIWRMREKFQRSYMAAKFNFIFDR